MKLRNRTKCVLGNIKQEDRKPVLNAAESSTPTTNDPNAVKHIIKQEDTKDHKLLLAQKGESDTKNYYYQCDICKKKMANYKSVMEHRFSIHNISPRALRNIKDINVEADTHDPNFYCKPCERSYISRNRFRQHLKCVHYLVLKPLPNYKLPQAGAVPDPDDPNLYCKACDHTYSTKHAYRAHCRYVHGMKLTLPTSGSAIDTYCQACDRRFSTVDSYRRHFFFIHKVDSRPVQQKQTDVLPNVNDPNLYCCSCDKKLANKRSFKQHLMAVHSIFQSAPRMKSRLEPDVDDPKNYCRACQKTFSSRGQYRRHLRLVHRMTLPPLETGADLKILPDPYNSDHYCSACKKTYASPSRYRDHCKRVHLMILNHNSIRNPFATIDVNDSNFHCAQCGHSFANKSNFAKHLGRVHNI